MRKGETRKNPFYTGWDSRGRRIREYDQQVELSVEWLKKYTSIVEHINLENSSFQYRRNVGLFTMTRIRHDAFKEAARRIEGIKIKPGKGHTEYYNLHCRIDL